MIFGINTTLDITIVSNFTCLTAREITYNNFEISLVVFMPNITINHAITYTNYSTIGISYTFNCDNLLYIYQFKSVKIWLNSIFSLSQVVIDDVNIRDLNLQAARRSMAVITQDPVLFSGSLRVNLDPFSLYDDHDVWMALEEVQLKTLVQQLPGHLEYKLKESGSNFSVGERQLLCLARALLQKSKIIILDEATANVDYKTDYLIQDVIRNRFKESTVLTIAHRLNTIMDYDKVIVMDQGRVVEFDKPELLLHNKTGFFSRLVQSHNASENQSQ